MKCPCCGGAKLTQDTRNFSYTYKGKTTSIPAVTAGFCHACGELVLSREHGDRHNELVSDFQRQVNTTSINAEYIAKVRKKFNHSPMRS